VSPHYDRNFAVAQESLRDGATDVTTDEDAVEGAAEALREVEVEAAQTPAALATESSADDLDSMSIDELRKLAASLEVPNRARVTDREELVAAIRARR
jgi:hypothetical protein